MVSKREYDRIYDSGRKEQLEQDIAMIKSVVERSEDYDDFRQRLSDELRKLDLNMFEE